MKRVTDVFEITRGIILNCSPLGPITITNHLINLPLLLLSSLCENGAVGGRVLI